MDTNNDAVFFEYERPANWYVCKIIDGKQYSRFGNEWLPLMAQLRQDNRPNLYPLYQAKRIKNATYHKWQGNPLAPDPATDSGAHEDTVD